MLHVSFRTGLSVVFIAAALSACTPGSFQQAGIPLPESRILPATETRDRHLPTLVVSDDPPPEVIYHRGSRDTLMSGASNSDAYVAPRYSSSQNVETPVTEKADDLAHELEKLQSSTHASEAQLRELQGKNDAGASAYYAVVASINTELQAGTTPGNPILVERWNTAQEKLNGLEQDAGLLNDLATDLSNQASHASYLLDATQAAFSLSGAVPEDHQKLTVIEDGVNQNIALINRLLTKTNDEIGRRTAYLRAEHANLQTLSLGISNGDLYGQNLTNSLFRKASNDGTASLYKPGASSSVDMGSSLSSSGRRPLVIIRFDRPNVNYDQPLYNAISQAMEKYPGAKFDLVAVSNLEGNAAQLALASAEARKNGEAVLRSLTQMGLPLERIRLSAASSKDVVNSEVHIYLQ